MKKIFLIFAIFFAGIINVKALEKEDMKKIYCSFDKTYRLIGALNYYYDFSSGYDSKPDPVKTMNEAIDIYGKPAKGNGLEICNFNYSFDDTAINGLYSLFSNGSGIPSASLAQKIREMSNIPDGMGQDLYNYVNDYYTTTLPESKNLNEMLGIAQTALLNLADNLKNSDNNYYDLYQQTINQTKIAYSGICDYLSHHQGINYYVKMILQIISYAALAIAVILGSLDFIKAITSQDDAALKKAFQSFVKRIVAVALIFLANVIVQLVLNLVPNLPNYTAEALELKCLQNIK